METEVHVYAFAIAASVLLSFFPFLVVVLTFCKHILRWPAAVDAVNLALADFFPGTLLHFIRRNLAAVVDQRSMQLASLLMLLFVANGIFEPLEVALNTAWGISRHRSFLRNQAVSMALVLVCGTLALASTTLTALNYAFLPKLFGLKTRLLSSLGLVLFEMAAIPLSMLMLFLIYWLLPNRRIQASQVLPAAVGVGLALEVVKYLNLLTWPWLQAKLAREYGPFVYSVSIVLWSFFASLVVLAGGEWAARHSANAGEPNPPASCLDCKCPVKSID
jgi:YihY family inner membrane protein